MDATWLKGKLPQPNLVSMAHHFLDRVSMAEHNVLRDIARGLDGKTVTVGTTCSGLETGVLCTKALFQAINQRFGTNVLVCGQFAVEVNPAKQRFILEAHGDEVRHLFSDVSIFAEGDTAWCLKSQAHVPIPEVFLLISGVACVNLSSQNVNRGNFANCYRDGSGASGHTYVCGFKKAVQKTKAQVSLYENVQDAAKSLKDSSGEPQTPAVDVITEDFARFGHIFEWDKYCTSQFLLPQRRARVWGSSCAGEDKNTYSVRMKLTGQRMRSSMRFALEDFLQKDLPKVSMTSETNKKHVAQVKKICRKKGLDPALMTMDMQSSEAWGPEWAGPSLMTCCRPTHGIYHLGLERPLRGLEMLAAHGVFADCCLS